MNRNHERSNDIAESRPATVAGVVVLGLLKALQRARVEPAPLCRAVGLEMAFLEEPNARVSTGLVTRLLAHERFRLRVFVVAAPASLRNSEMTSRSLQRKLAEEGTGFRALRDSVLWETVEVALSNPSLKIEAIALGVGFSDVAAFSKAFRRWKGCFPTRYRETLGKREGPEHSRN